MRISDWSSDVCSSDLLGQLGIEPTIDNDIIVRLGGPAETGRGFVLHSTDYMRQGSVAIDDSIGKIGRESCRERVCQYVEISVVAVSLKKKTQERTTNNVREPLELHSNKYNTTN